MEHILDKYSGSLLASLFFHGVATRGQLLKTLKLRLNSLVDSCDRLEAAGLIERENPDRRRNARLRLAAGHFGALGLEHRSDSLRMILLDISGAVVAYEEQQLAPDHRPEDLAAAAARFLVSHPVPEVVSIGMADFGIVSPGRGIGVFSANHPNWRDVPLREIFSTLSADFTLLTRTEADMLAEDSDGEQIFVRVSDGIGTAITLDGDGLPARGIPIAGELGHTVSVPGGALCRCGNRGCLETVAGMAALRHAAGVSSLEELAARAAAGDHFVENLLREGGEHLGVALANLVVLTGITGVVVKMPLELPAYVEAANMALRRGVIYPFNSRLTIKFGVLARESSALGAARLGRREYFERISRL